MKKNIIKKIVKARYGKIAEEKISCCSINNYCCGIKKNLEISYKIGYSKKELKSLPEGVNLGLGCGNPLAFALIKKGDVVLDLGSGTGIDVLLAAKKVGNRGKVIGVDMTPEMIAQARINAEKGDYKNVEFILGEIDNLPIADNSVDVIISNCVINLSLDKKKVFEEAYRVLKPNGKLAIADIVLEKELPPNIKTSIDAYIGCVAGAILKDNYLNIIKNAGFKNVRVVEQTKFPLDCGFSISDAKDNIKRYITDNINDFVLSIKVSAIKR